MESTLKSSEGTKSAVMSFAIAYVKALVEVLNIVAVGFFLFVGASLAAGFMGFTGSFTGYC